MQFVRQTPTHFTLCLRPFKVWLLCGTLASVGFGVLIELGRVTTLSCDRFGLLIGSCQVVSIGLEGERVYSLPLAQVYGADVDFMHRIVLYTNEQFLPLTAPYSDFSLTRQIIAARINHFLVNPVAIRLVFQDDGRSFAYPFGAVFIIGSGLILIIFGSVVVYEIDRSRSIVTLRRQGILKGTINHYPLADITRLHIEISEGIQGQTDCRICLLLHSGQSVPFTPHYGLNCQDARKTLQQIEAFLLQNT